MLFCVLTALDICGSSRCPSYSWPWACIIYVQCVPVFKIPASTKHHSFSLVWLPNAELLPGIKSLFTPWNLVRLTDYSPWVMTSPPPRLLWLSVLLCPPYSQFRTFLHLCWLWMWFQTTGPEKLSVCRAGIYSLQHPAKSLVILEGPLPNYRKDVAFLSLWPPLQGVGLRCHCDSQV